LTCEENANLIFNILKLQGPAGFLVKKENEVKFIKEENRSTPIP